MMVLVVHMPDKTRPKAKKTGTKEAEDKTPDIFVAKHGMQERERRRSL